MEVNSQNVYFFMGYKDVLLPTRVEKGSESIVWGSVFSPQSICMLGKSISEKVCGF